MNRTLRRHPSVSLIGVYEKTQGLGQAVDAIIETLARAGLLIRLPDGNFGVIDKPGMVVAWKPATSRWKRFRRWFKGPTPIPPTKAPVTPSTS